LANCVKPVVFNWHQVKISMILSCFPAGQSRQKNVFQLANKMKLCVVPSCSLAGQSRQARGFQLANKVKLCGPQLFSGWPTASGK
jgi:hypothetical protein